MAADKLEIGVKIEFGTGHITLTHESLLGEKVVLALCDLASPGVTVLRVRR